MNRIGGSSFELVELIDVSGAVMAVNGDDQGETDSGFGGGDGDGKDRDQYAGGLMRFRTEAPKCDEIQVRRGKHQLNTNQNENSMTAAEGGEQADGE